MSGYNPGSQHSSPSKGLVSALSRLESNVSSLDSLLKEAAASAQGFVNDDEESFSGSSVELESNYSEGNSESFVPLNLIQDSSSFEFSVLPSRYKDVIENLKSKISYQTNYFSLESKPEGNEVRLNCKVCRKMLPITKVEEHVVDQAHLRNLAMKCNTVADSKENWNPKTSNVSDTLEDLNNNAQKYLKKVNFAALSSAQESNENHSSNVKTLSSGEKLAKDLTDKLKDYMNYFESYENRWYELCFSCKICRKSFPSKNGKLHIYTNTHLRNLRKSLSVAKLEALDARNAKTVRSLIKQFNNRLYFFQLIHDSELNELYFVCKVCSVVLVPECLVDHIYSPEHSKSVQENPVVLNYDTLSDYNKDIIKELTGVIRVFRIKDFTFVYRIGTDDLRLYCKCCQLTLIPDKVEDHVFLSEHILAAKAESYLKRKTFEGDASTNGTSPSKTGLSSLQVTSPAKTKSRILKFDSLNRTHKAIVEKLEDALGSELLYFELAPTDTSELHFKCTLCDLVVKYNVVAQHVEHLDHTRNCELRVLFKEFVSLEASSKKMLRKLFSEVGGKLMSFQLAPSFDSIEPRFTCKFCNITLCADFVANHLQTKNHKKLSGEAGSKICVTPVSRPSLQDRDSRSSSTGDEDSESCASTVSEDSSKQGDSKNSVDYEPTSSQVEDTDCLAVGVHSRPASVSSGEITSKLARDSIEGVLKKRSDEILMPNLERQGGSNETRFVSHDSEKSTKTVAPNLKNFSATKSSLLGSDKSQSPFKRNPNGLQSSGISQYPDLLAFRKTAPELESDASKDSYEANAYGLESDGIRHRPDTSAFCKNSSEFESDVPRDSYEEILGTLSKKISIKITNFDFMLTGGSNELWFCTFCSEMVQPDTIENHVDHKAYLKWSNDSKEEIVKKFLNNTGNKINDFDLSVTVGFICKICGGTVNAETVKDHIGSKEHRKCRGSHKISARRSEDGNQTVSNQNFQSSAAACDTSIFRQFESTSPNAYDLGHDKHSSGISNNESRLNTSNSDPLFYFFVFYFIVFVYALFYFKDLLVLQ